MPEVEIKRVWESRDGSRKAIIVVVDGVLRLDTYRHGYLQDSEAFPDKSIYWVEEVAQRYCWSTTTTKGE